MLLGDAMIHGYGGVVQVSVVVMGLSRGFEAVKVLFVRWLLAFSHSARIIRRRERGTNAFSEGVQFVC